MLCVQIQTGNLVWYKNTENLPCAGDTSEVRESTDTEDENGKHEVNQSTSTSRARNFTHCILFSLGYHHLQGTS